MLKNISLKSLKLKNFKGLKELNIDFSKITNIYGENATGKTTVFDAATWLLFDKDSQDRTVGDKESNFQIKTYDSSGEVIHGLEHEVTGVLSVDGKDITLTKIYKEKWTKKRGEAERNLTGHETLYCINEVPVKKSEYQEAINKIIDENLFKLISNPLYFSTNMKWQDRRNVLLDIIGDITVDKIINYKTDLKAISVLLQDNDIDTLKKSIQARKRKLNDEIKAIPIRIDEANNSIKEIDFDVLEFRKRGIASDIKILEEQLLDSSKVNEEVLKEKDKLYRLKVKLRDLEYKAIMEIGKPKQELEEQCRQIENEIFKLNSQSIRLEDKRNFCKVQIEQLEKQAEELRNRWFIINKESYIFDEATAICPTCKRRFDEHDIETQKQEMEENFNQHKSNRLKDISIQGTGLKKKTEILQEDVKAITSEIELLNDKLSDYEIVKQELQEKIKNYVAKDPLIEDKEYQTLKIEITELEQRLQQPTTVNTQVQELKERKANFQLELEEVNAQLVYKEQNQELKDRIKKLQEDEKKLAQQIATLEGQEFLCEEFIKTKVELLENSINNKFKYVSFKLFDTQVNGGLNETCEALINGVPFSNANTASRMNAGLDIINALSEHYGVQATIFIDNRESVNKLIDTDSQIINLIVSSDKNLKVEVI